MFVINNSFWNTDKIKIFATIWKSKIKKAAPLYTYLMLYFLDSVTIRSRCDLMSDCVTPGNSPTEWATILLHVNNVISV